MEDIPMTKKYIVDTIYNLNFAISKNLPYCYLGFDEEANNDIWVKKENWNKILSKDNTLIWYHKI